MTTTSPFTVANARTVVGAACAALLIVGVATTPADRPADQALRSVVVGPSVQPSLAFVHAGAEVWYQPLAVYPSRWLLAAGLTPHLALRLPSIVAGMLTIVLAYVLAVRASGEVAIGAMTALLLVAMPGFRDASQAVGAGLSMVPLALAWFVAVLKYLDRPRVWLPSAGGAALGACIYTQPAGVLSVPIFFALGASVLCRGARGRAAVWWSAVGVAAVTLPAVAWVVIHRDAYPDTFGRWAIHAAHIRSPWDGLVAFTRWSVMARRVEEYWHYFNPTFLFGGGVFGLPLLGLVPMGVWATSRRLSREARLMVLGGLCAAPLAAVLLDEPRQPLFAVMLLPLGGLAAAAAVPEIAARPRWRVAAVGGMVVLVFLSLTLARK